MGKCVLIDDLRKHLEGAKDRLTREKADILNLHPLVDDFCREEYAFDYVRAERIGLKIINRRLAEIAWLPLQLDPRTEILSESRQSMKRWLTSAFAVKPASEQFGNDFIHALTRCAMEHGGEHPNFMKLAGRIANLFRDLSCLVGLIYYCSWLSENKIEGVQLSNIDNLSHTAEEIATLVQSPEIYRYLRAQEQNDEKVEKAKKSASVKPVKKSRPTLRVIENKNFLDPFLPDPVTV
ncbi:MAG: hypothetical protein SFW62_07750 [Alphaproteobacteria bacterium]|nr:hypothetical protein [Alphaproteobacteria bacterium]